MGVSDTPVDQIRAKTGKCPHCRLELEVQSHAGIEGAVCPECHGVWLPAPALKNAIRLYAADHGVALETVSLLEGPAHQSALPCPQCASSSLQVITLRGVEVEKCVSCGGLFLDGGDRAVIAERVMRAAATWDLANQEFLRVQRQRLSFELTLARALRSDLYRGTGLF
jgi:Zn-finger nucleic acid-binding protein